MMVTGLIFYESSSDILEGKASKEASCREDDHPVLPKRHTLPLSRTYFSGMRGASCRAGAARRASDKAQHSTAPCPRQPSHGERR